MSVTRPDTRARGRGDRKRITRKSRRSLTRLRNELATVDSRLACLFVTLTYPGLAVFDEDYEAGKHPSKRHLDAFTKRMERAYPGCAFVWVVDQKHRKTGASEGDLVPHYHLMVWGVGVSISAVRATVREAWFQSVHGTDAPPSRDREHWQAGVSVEWAKSVGGLKGYLRSYCSRPKDEGFIDGFGRVWGIRGRKHLPRVEVRQLEVTDRGGARMVRALRRYVEAEARAAARTSGNWRGVRRARRYSLGVSVAVDDPGAWASAFIRAGWLVDPESKPPLHVILGKPPPRPIHALARAESAIARRMR